AQKTGFEAAVKAINAAGGVNGHPINGVACDTTLSTTGAVTCAQSAVNAHALAVVEDSNQEPTGTDAILTAADNSAPVDTWDAEELTAQNDYAFDLGDQGLESAAAVVANVVFKSYKNVVAQENVPAGLEIVPNWNASNRAHGFPQGRIILVPYGLPDAVPYVP